MAVACNPSGGKVASGLTPLQKKIKK